MTAKLVPLRRVSGDITEMSDEALLAACGPGDAPALGALFDRFHLAVYRFASRLPMTDDLARDDLLHAEAREQTTDPHAHADPHTNPHPHADPAVASGSFAVANDTASAARVPGRQPPGRRGHGLCGAAAGQEHRLGRRMPRRGVRGDDDRVREGAPRRHSQGQDV